jgi:hypothetical protein
MMRKIKRASFSVLFTSLLLVLLFIQGVYAYENTIFGFSITPPASWIIYENPEQTGILYVAAIFQNPDWDARIDVWVEDTNNSLMDYREGIEEILADSYENSKLLSEQNRSVDGLDCYEVVFTATQNFLVLKYKQAYFVGNGKLYVVICSAWESEYSYSISDFDASISSFRIIEASNPSDGSPDNTMLIIGILATAVILAVLVVILLLKKRGHAHKRKHRGR